MNEPNTAEVPTSITFHTFDNRFGTNLMSDNNCVDLLMSDKHRIQEYHRKQDQR